MDTTRLHLRGSHGPRRARPPREVTMVKKNDDDGSSRIKDEKVYEALRGH